MICGTIEATVLDGTAKPMPSLPPDSLLICVLTPTTSPAALSSGPPELPWLMAASVWIELEMVKLFGEVISRFSALTMPLVSVPSSPKGLPSATTLSPTDSDVRVAERERDQDVRGSVDLDDGEVGGRVRADDGRVVGRAVPEADRDRLGAVHDVVVRDDVALGVEDEAGALAAGLLLAAGGRGLAQGRRDLDDALVGLLVDLADGQRLGGRGHGLRRLGGCLADGGRRTVLGAERREGRRPSARADGCGGNERCGDGDDADGAGSHDAIPFRGVTASMPATPSKTRLRGR